MSNCDDFNSNLIASITAQDVHQYGWKDGRHVETRLSIIFVQILTKFTFPLSLKCKFPLRTEEQAELICIKMFGNQSLSNQTGIILPSPSMTFLSFRGGNF